MRFEEIISVLDVEEMGGNKNTPVRGICYDSRRAEPGRLFVAVEGYQTDGHLYIDQAVANGATAVVIQKKVKIPPGASWVRVRDSRLALAKVSNAFYNYPSRQMTLIGVTGTNGKTTTSHLINEIFRTAGKKCGLISTVYNRIGEKILPVSHTTPESLDLQRLLREMSDDGMESVVMEVSSHALFLHRVAGCEFDVGVFTNITRDHLDFHRDMQDYMEAKAKLFSSLGNPSHKQRKRYAVINADDSAAGYISKVSSAEVITYGIKNQADVKASEIEIKPGGASFQVNWKGKRYPLQLKITGLFNVYNALAAFTVGMAEGFAPEIIGAALNKVEGVSGRFQKIDRGQDFTVIVDYAHTPDGLENVLKTARQITENRLVTVFGCGGDRDRQKRPLMGEIGVKYSDFAVLTSDNPRTEDPEKIIADIEEGARKVAGGSYIVVPDRREAISYALEKASAGDVVVIAGKGHETYQIIGQRRLPFDDSKVAAQVLEELVLPLRGTKNAG